MTRYFLVFPNSKKYHKILSLASTIFAFRKDVNLKLMVHSFHCVSELRENIPLQKSYEKIPGTISELAVHKDFPHEFTFSGNDTQKFWKLYLVYQFVLETKISIQIN